VSVLAIRAVDVWFPGGPEVLHQIDLEVEAGEHWALLGANGAGKSTLLALAGAQRFPSRGTVDVLGRRLGRVDVRELRRAIGVVDARLRLPAGLSVEAYVGTGATQTVQPVGEPDTATARRVAELVDLLALTPLATRAIRVCSQGEQARARLARALMPRPSLLLLDEPAAGLDLPGRADLLDAIEAAARDDAELASITVAHHLEELPAVTSHVALLRDGRVMAQGDVSLLNDAEVLSQCFGRSVRSFDVGGRWFATALPA
jgi:iron complex transport system ATP-binding protein